MKTLKITKSDLSPLEASEPTQSFGTAHKVKNLKLYWSSKKVNGERALSFVFIFDQNSKTIDQTQPIEKQWTFFKKTKGFFGVDRFAPEHNFGTKLSASWFTNKIKKSKCETWEASSEMVGYPDERKQRNIQNNLEEKTKNNKKANREQNLKNLEANLTTKTIYSALKAHKSKD